MLLARPLIVDGELWGTTYTLENIGDELPVHTHDEHTNHITVLTFGSIRVLGARDGIVLTARPGGTIVNWKPHEPHGARALTEGATFVNIRKRR